MSHDFFVERAITIDAPPERVYPHVIDFRKWTAWSPWTVVDSLDVKHSGAESGIGARYAWSGAGAGQGTMEIIDAGPHSSIEIALEVLKPFSSHNTVRFSFAPEDDRTAVTWSISGATTFLLRVTGVVKRIEAAMQRDLERGLAKLKSVVEGS